MQSDAVAERAVVVTEELVRRHQASVWRYLRFLGAPRDVADELAQETFLALLRKTPADRGDAELAGWLRVTARNLFVSRRRALRPELAGHADAAVEAVFVELAGESGGDEYARALDACLATLDAREREAVRLRYRDDAARGSIAAQLGVTEEGVKSLLRRVKARLRACIERRLRDG